MVTAFSIPAFRGDIEYDGYFNPRKCYTYQNSRFEPTAAATTEPVTVTLPNGTTRHQDNSMSATMGDGAETC